MKARLSCTAVSHQNSTWLPKHVMLVILLQQETSFRYKDPSKMAKKKLGLANRKLKKNSSKFQKSRAGPSNSFEIHLNKRKFEVLGRKQKHERGLPGISRSRATKQVSI